MLLNYLKVALRAIRRNRLTSFINIAGLALSMACCLLIYLYIQDELSYDRHNKNADRIYRVTRNFLSPDGSVSLHLGHVAPPFGPLLKNDFSQMEEVARTLNYNLLFALEENGERKLSFNEPNTFLAEPQIAKIFTLEMIDGNPVDLERPFTMMLSDKMAHKYFGATAIQGKHLRANNQYDIEITGVYKSFPPQSHWHPDFLVSFSTLFDENLYGRQNLETNWGNNSFGTYVLANEQFDAAELEKQFPAFLDRHMGAVAAERNYPMPSTWTTLFLQPLTDIHLHSHLDSEVEANGNINTVYMMGVIGLFIILIACFNFVNLSTARATKRSKEVGLRKVVGAFKGQLVLQYLSESVVIAFIALILALVLSSIGLNWLNDFTNKSIQLNYLTNALDLTVIIGSTVLVGLLAGIYPSFVISGFKPALILKAQSGTTHGKGTLRRVLVVAQFSISIVLIIATLVSFQQLDYLNQRELGYAKDQVVTLRYFSDDLGDRYDAFYNELTRGSAVLNACRSSITPTGRLLDSQGTSVQKGDSLAATNVVIKDVRVDHEFFDTYQIQFASGRNFSREILSDDSLAFIINEAAARMIGWTNEEAIGKVFANGDVKGQVIGVVKDFHFESLHEEIVPVVFHRQPYFRRLSVRIAATDFQEGIRQLETIWHEFLPERPFEYAFLSDRYRELYESEQKQSQLFIIFSGLAILIASLGLLGLATFNAMQRTREIGIRKVMGASIPSILRLLSKEIVVMIVIANLIAWPIAWYFTTGWLEGFAYRIQVSWVLYAVAALSALMIGLLTVSSQTIKAAMTNPARTLRNE